MSQEKQSALLRCGALALLAGAALWLGFAKLFPALLPFILGALIAEPIRRVSAPLAEKLGIDRRLAAVVGTTLVFFVCGWALWLFVLLLFSAGRGALAYSPVFLREELLPLLAELGERLPPGLPELAESSRGLYLLIESSLAELSVRVSSLAMDWVKLVGAQVPGLLLGALATIVSAYLISAREEAGAAAFVRLLPASARRDCLEFLRGLGGTLLRLLRAYLLILALTFLELAAGLFLLRVEGWAIWAAVIALLDLLPLIGSGLIIIPWGLLTLLRGELALGGGLLLLYAVMAVVRNIVEPKLVGEELGLDPLAALIALFVGLRLFGAFGALLAPLAVFSAKRLWERRTQENRPRRTP